MESSNGVPHPGSMQFFGLLHVEDGRRQSANLRHGDDAAAAIYLGNAVRLSNALAAVGCEFTLLTNDAARLGAIDVREFGSGIAMREIPFSAAVPPTAGFYSAHFKVDVFRWFAKFAPEGYPILVDVDAVALRVPPQTLRNCAAAGLPLVYDSSDQVIPPMARRRSPPISPCCLGRTRPSAVGMAANSSAGGRRSSRGSGTRSPQAGSGIASTSPAFTTRATKS